MYLLKLETKIVKFEATSFYLCNFNYSQIFVKANFTVVKFNSNLSSNKISERCNEQVFYKKSFLKNSQYSQKSTCVGVSFCIKKQAFSLQNFIKKTLQHRCFPVNIAKFLKTPVSNKIREPLFERFLHEQIT